MKRLILTIFLLLGCAASHRDAGDRSTASSTPRCDDGAHAAIWDVADGRPAYWCEESFGGECTICPQGATTVTVYGGACACPAAPGSFGSAVLGGDAGAP